jgi:hypothetical protein
VTQSGHIGCGPREILPGDVLCIIFGSQVPLVLRPKEDYYLLIGAVYVYDIMDGEAITAWKAGEMPGIKEQVFKVHWAAIQIMSSISGSTVVGAWCIRVGIMSHLWLRKVWNGSVRMVGYEQNPGEREHPRKNRPTLEIEVLKQLDFFIITGILIYNHIKNIMQSGLWSRGHLAIKHRDCSPRERIPLKNV